jgi:hypothetical protein
MAASAHGLCSTLNVNVGTVTAAGVVAAACFRRPEQEEGGAQIPSKLVMSAGG